VEFVTSNFLGHIKESENPGLRKFRVEIDQEETLVGYISLWIRKKGYFPNPLAGENQVSYVFFTRGEILDPSCI